MLDLDIPGKDDHEDCIEAFEFITASSVWIASTPTPSPAATNIAPTVSEPTASNFP